MYDPMMHVADGFANASGTVAVTEMAGLSGLSDVTVSGLMSNFWTASLVPGLALAVIGGLAQRKPFGNKRKLIKYYAIGSALGFVYWIANQKKGS